VLVICAIPGVVLTSIEWWTRTSQVTPYIEAVAGPNWRQSEGSRPPSALAFLQVSEQPLKGSIVMERKIAAQEPKAETPRSGTQLLDTYRAPHRVTLGTTVDLVQGVSGSPANDYYGYIRK